VRSLGLPVGWAQTFERAPNESSYWPRTTSQTRPYLQSHLISGSRTVPQGPMPTKDLSARAPLRRAWRTRPRQTPSQRPARTQHARLRGRTYKMWNAAPRRVSLAGPTSRLDKGGGWSFRTLWTDPGTKRATVKRSGCSCPVEVIRLLRYPDGRSAYRLNDKSVRCVSRADSWAKSHSNLGRPSTRFCDTNQRLRKTPVFG